MCGCGISDKQYDDLKTENFILSAKVDSLSHELNDLKFGANTLFREANLKNENKDFVETKVLLVRLIKRYPTSEECDKAKLLLISVNPKAEYQSFNLAKNNHDTVLLGNYIKDYPKGRFVSNAKALIGHYRSNAAMYLHKADAEKYIPVSNAARKRPYTKAVTRYEQSNIRIGAMCCDGTRSYATRRMLTSRRCVSMAIPVKPCRINISINEKAYFEEISSRD